MSISKKKLLASMVILLSSSHTWAQQAGQQDVFRQQEQIIRVVSLSHSDASSVASALHALAFTVAMASTDENQIILRGTAAEVTEVVELIRTRLDVPNSASNESRTVTEFISLGQVPTDTLMPALKAVVTSRFSQLAIDRMNRMLVVQAQPSEIAAVRSMLELSKRPARTLMLNFFFVRAQIDGSQKGQSALPDMLQPIASTLQESGFGNLSLMAPVSMMIDDGQEFQSESELDLSDARKQAENLSFRVEGIARSQLDNDTVHLSIRAGVAGKYGSNGGDHHRTHFEANTTLAMKTGSYVLLAAAPSSTSQGDAIALVVRVTEVEKTVTR